MDIQVAFPDELLIALKEDIETFRRKALIYTLGKLYEKGRISGGLAANILQCDRWELYGLLSENSFSVIDYPEEELNVETENVRRLLKRKKLKSR